jgi:transcriptional regulator with GAF, ATPase, and Fis domain
MAASKIQHLASLCESLRTLLENEQNAGSKEIASLIEAVQSIQHTSADRRWQRLLLKLRQLDERIGTLSKIACQDFIAKIQADLAHLADELVDSRLTRVVQAIIDAPLPGLSPFCEQLLDRLIEVTGAERGFILFYAPETTEADIVAARYYSSTNLSLQEFDLSRTLLYEALRSGASLFVEDALNHPRFSNEASVRHLEIKSVLAVPFRQRERTLGAIYLENNTRPCAFAESDRDLLERAARFVMFYLCNAGLLPTPQGGRVHHFFDAGKASSEIVGQDSRMLELQATVQRIADSTATVLIQGESGTGKELVARALHTQSARHEKPFVVINCAAIPENLFESELFGHEKGAFTGAAEKYLGRIEQADGGTLFLDELGDMPYGTQAKLLRFLQCGEFDRLGGRETIRVEARIVAATSKDLKSLIDAKKFQEALYFRLNVIPLSVPPLRERKGDIPYLTDVFLQRFCTIYRKSIVLDPEVYDLLQAYPFPGNVRELENLLHRIVALAADETIHASDLPKEILSATAHRVSLQKDPLYRLINTEPSDLDDLRQRRQEINRLLRNQERKLITRVLAQAGGNFTEAAKMLGVHRVTLHKMFREKDEKSDRAAES